MFNFKDKFYKIIKNAFDFGWIAKKEYLMIVNIYKYNGVLPVKFVKNQLITIMIIKRCQ